MAAVDEQAVRAARVPTGDVEGGLADMNEAPTLQLPASQGSIGDAEGGLADVNEAPTLQLPASQGSPSRAEAAQLAFKAGDTELSRKLHDPAEFAKLLPGMPEHEEPKSLDGGVVKPMVFGGLDG